MHVYKINQIQCWSDMKQHKKSDTKKIFTELRKHREGTGGGKAAKELGDVDYRILNLLGKDMILRMEVLESQPLYEVV
ncbi:hypothetical protein JTE90_005234 [Oedothorax gibbosus]|uniref:Uncharacterized protein n=1 Tax=Oedothorax gibbosus TaxID=931172 RepID=A0AAV6TRU0_9ARAC|nr:hypothetical protein JTE90_005234 [Oedothorax gibbosus]